MKHCNSCNVDVNTNSHHCPLCFNELETKTNEKQPKILDISTKKPKEIIKNHTTRKIFLLISLAVILITCSINYFTKGAPWSLVIVASIVYLWIFVKHTIMSHRHIFEKFVLHFLGIIGILMASNYVSGGGLWFADYVLPSLLVVVLIVLDMMLLLNPRRRMWQISFMIIQFIIMIVSIVFICIDYCSFRILYKISMLLAILSIAGIIILDGKNLIQEITKKFHL